MATTREAVTDTMSGSDALLWTIGRDPVLRQTVVAVLSLGSAPDWEVLRERFGRLTEIVPRLRSRAVVRPAVRGRPQFVADPHFDLDLHLRRLTLPPGSTFREVLTVAQHMGTTAFDPLLAPWEAVLMEGVDGDRAALVVKLHHAVVDGVGGFTVLGHLLEDGPEAIRRSGQAATPRPPTVSMDPMRYVRQARRVVGATLRAGTQPAASARQLMSTGASVARLMAPAGRPLSPVMTGRGFRRVFEVVDLPKGKLRRAAHATESTLNEVFVTAIMRGLKRYHELHGTELDQLRALMPVNVRHGEASLGNHFVPARFLVPTGEDASQCLSSVKRITGEWKHASGLALSDVMADGLSMLPPSVATALWGSMLKGDDFCITNVPGPPFTAYLAGALVERIYAFAPTSGAALNVSLISLDGRECVGINVDAAALTDSSKLALCIEEGFGEVFALAPGRHRNAP